MLVLMDPYGNWNKKLAFCNTPSRPFSNNDEGDGVIVCDGTL